MTAFFYLKFLIEYHFCPEVQLECRKMSHSRKHKSANSHLATFDAFFHCRRNQQISKQWDKPFNKSFLKEHSCFHIHFISHSFVLIHTYQIACPMYESMGLNCHCDRNFTGNLLIYFIFSKSFQLIATSTNYNGIFHQKFDSFIFKCLLL